MTLQVVKYSASNLGKKLLRATKNNKNQPTNRHINTEEETNLKEREGTRQIRFRLFTKNIAPRSTKDGGYCLPGEFFNGRGTLTVQR